jgi:hypothetical protein
VRPARDDLVPGDGRAAADDAVDGEDRPGDPVQVADVFRDHLREDADVAGVAERTATTSGTARRPARMAGSVWLTHRDMNATSSQPRARRSRRWRKGLNAPSPARCRSRAWTARNPARASRPASVKAGWIVGSRAKRNRVGCTAAPEQIAGLPGSPVGAAGQHSCTPRWRSYGFCLMFSLGWLETAVAHRRAGPAASATVRPAFSQRSVVLVPSTRTGAGGCGITPADSTRLWRHSQYRFLHSWPAGWTGR